MISSAPALSWLCVAIALVHCSEGISLLPCHCAEGRQCHDNGYCPNGCASGWFGPGCQVGNYALNKTAYQSSLYNEDLIGNTIVDHSAAMAVDGRDQDGSFAKYCSHTKLDSVSPSWWYVELDHRQDIVLHDVTIYDRQNQRQRLANFSIVYTSMSESQLPDSDWSTCVYSSGIQPETKYTYKCQGSAAGKKLGIRLRNQNTSNILTLCEVIVNGYSKMNCSEGFTGPGCLLHDCKTRNCFGGCSEFGGCIYSTCPDPSYAPPDCWMRLPSLRALTLLPSITCNSLIINISGQINVGDLSISSLLLEMNADYHQLSVNTTVTVKENSIETGLDVTSGRVYNIRLIPQWCNGSLGLCLHGQGSKWANFSTEIRDYTYWVNENCFLFNASHSESFCENLKWQVSCVDSITLKPLRRHNDSVVCEYEAYTQYTCIVKDFAGESMIETHVYYISDNTAAQSVFERYHAVLLTATSLSGFLMGGLIVLIISLRLRRRYMLKTVASKEKNAYIELHETGGQQSADPYSAINPEIGTSVEDNYAELSVTQEVHSREVKHTSYYNVYYEHQE